VESDFLANRGNESVRHRGQSVSECAIPLYRIALDSTGGYSAAPLDEARPTKAGVAARRPPSSAMPPRSCRTDAAKDPTPASNLRSKKEEAVQNPFPGYALGLPFLIMACGENTSQLLGPGSETQREVTPASASRASPAQHPLVRLESIGDPIWRPVPAVLRLRCRGMAVLGRGTDRQPHPSTSTLVEGEKSSSSCAAWCARHPLRLVFAAEPPLPAGGSHKLSVAVRALRATALVGASGTGPSGLTT
jgi:hypothetical protein